MVDPILAVVKVTRPEIDALVAVLDYYIPDLHAEITRTSEGSLRTRLRDQEAMLTGLRHRLVAERADVRDEEADELLGL